METHLTSRLKPVKARAGEAVCVSSFNGYGGCESGVDEMKDECKCGYCNGAGRVPLSGVYQRTLDLLRKQDNPISGHALARIAKCKGAAMCNRLVMLERYHFVMSKRFGREHRYVAKENYMGGWS